MIDTGTTLQQRYKIDKQIGQGGMGAVYVATDERFGSVVAIKETLCMDDNFRKAIEREARLLNSLKHVALPRVSDHFEESNGQFLVMEYIPGDDVASMLADEHGAFSVEQVLKWADQLLDALDYLHNQNVPVIHRDIKPQNLKINANGQIILLDFGLAKGNPTDAGHKTEAKSIFGYSKNYASLEQIQGTGTDPRSDLYSLAATLYHLLTGDPPEDALSRAMSVLSQKPDPLVPVNVTNPQVPDGIAGVLQKALDLNASERPASAAEMRKMLNDSDDYAYLTDAVTISAATKAKVLGQETKIMPDATRPIGVKQADIKTEVLPAHLSELTAVGKGRTGAAPAHVTAAPAKNRRGFAIGAAGLSVLLVGAAVGGIYVMNPWSFAVGTSTDSSTALPVVSEPVANANVEPSQSGSESLSATNTSTTETEPKSEKTAETTKNKKAGGTEQSGDQTNTGELTGIKDPQTPENTVSTGQDEGGKVTTLPVDPNRPPIGMGPIPPGIDPRNLTPEQRRRIQMIRNGQRPPPPDGQVPPPGQRPPRPRN